MYGEILLPYVPKTCSHYLFYNTVAGKSIKKSPDQIPPYSSFSSDVTLTSIRTFYDSIRKEVYIEFVNF